jgi:hypothetical protein
MNNTTNTTNTNSTTNSSSSPRPDTVGLVLLVFVAYILFIICGGCILARGVRSLVTQRLKKANPVVQDIDLTPLEENVERPTYTKECII